MSRYVDAEYVKAVMLNDRLMQGNAEYKLWEQEVEKKVDAMPSIDVMDVVTAYQQGWCDALDASISALNDAKFQLGKEAERKTTDTPQIFDKPPKCLGCVYSELDKAFHPCASCVDFSKYVGEVSADTPQTEDYDFRDEQEYNDRWQTDCGWK